MAFWSVVLPVAGTNLLNNPSFEYGTTGAFSLETATVGSSSAFQAFGAWSLSVTPSSVGTSGAILGTWNSLTGTAYTTSAYVRGAAGVQYCLDVRNNSSLNSVGSTAFTGGGTWQRVTFSYTEASPDLVRRLLVHKISGADTSAFYVDGANVSVGSVQTHIDGDQEGCSWDGAPHASTSKRSAQSRAGGSVVALADLGFTVEESPGIGMPPIDNNSLSYALQDGAQYQRTRAKERPFTLMSYIDGTTWQGLHGQRRIILDALKIDRVTPQQPTRFWYIGAGGTVQIDAVYDAGAEFGEPDGFTEHVSLRFIAYDPYWEATQQQGTALAPRLNLGSANYVVKRSPGGLWGTLGANGTTIDGGGGLNLITALAFNPAGTLFLGGRWGTLAGTTYWAAGQYYPSANTFGTLAGGSANSTTGTVYALATAPYGSLYVGCANITAWAGSTGNNLYQWNGAWGTLPAGTLDLNASVWSLLYSAYGGGTLFVGGSIATINGTTARHIAMWSAGTAGTLSGQTAGTIHTTNTLTAVRALCLGGDARLFYAGNFVSSGGTQTVNIGQWNGAFGSLSGGTLNGPAFALALRNNGKIDAGGNFTSLGNYITEWNYSAFAGLGAGLGQQVYAVLTDTDDTVYIGGAFTSAGGVSVPFGAVKWVGGAFAPLDINLSPLIGESIGSIFAMAFNPTDHSLYIAGRFAGSATAATIGTVVNAGMANAYPTLRIVNPSNAGTARLYQLVNTTTGDGIYFNLILQPGETATLDLTPGARSFKSTFRQNLMSSILAGANLATFKLLPGMNTISFFCDSDSVQPAIFWTPRNWSADGGTVF